MELVASSPLPVVTDRTADLLPMFDTAIQFGGMVTLFEQYVPGAVDALRCWAGMRGLDVYTFLSDAQGRPFRVCLVDVGRTSIRIHCEVPQ